MKRRQVLGGLATAGAALAAPKIVQAQNRRVLKFVPDADLAVIDPVITTSYQTRDHGFMVFDSLYGQDDQYRIRPQMAEGHVMEDDGKTWKITLRDGLKFHDGERVLARDCVASIQRWGKRDSFGQALMAATNELVALLWEQYPRGDVDKRDQRKTNVARDIRELVAAGFLLQDAAGLISVPKKPSVQENASV